MIKLGENGAARDSEIQQELTIRPPNFKVAKFKLIGISPLVQARFSAKAMETMQAKMRLGSAAKKGKKRDPRDFDLDYKNAMHTSKDGWHGVPTAAFRNAMISACKVVGFKMTQAKLAIFPQPDGIDSVDGLPLVKLEGDPKPHTMYVRNQTGVCDIRVRPMWEKWSVDLRVEYDADLFLLEDVANLLSRAGRQVGICEGRPDSKQSAGLGWGTFKIQDRIEVKK